METMITRAGVALAASLSLAYSQPATTAERPVVDTGQDICYDDAGTVIVCPSNGQPFAGQDAQHQGRQAAYVDNGDGTVSDLATGLMWQQTPGVKLTWDEARAEAASASLAGYSDWRLPTIKELYSLMDFRGVTGTSAADSTPYIDTDDFDFSYGDPSAGERFIDAQYWSSTEYVSSTMNAAPTVFGVNFADGRIKGYPKSTPSGGDKAMFVRLVRGRSGYGECSLSDNGDGTVTDWTTGLMWSQHDSGTGMTWQAALAWIAARNDETWLGYSDWRLPNAKELQSLVDYTRSPDTSGSPAIDPVFATSFLDDGEVPYFWTSTTHLDGPARGDFAVYVAFGRALGWMEQPRGSGNYELLDVHGAGAQRSDPKTGDPDAYPHGHGPQGDVIRIFNYVRAVRDAGASPEPHPGPEHEISTE